jgi:hypothetical protein
MMTIVQTAAAVNAPREGHLPPRLGTIGTPLAGSGRGGRDANGFALTRRRAFSNPPERFPINGTQGEFEW